MHGTPIDEKYQRAMEFAKHFKHENKTSSISNVYVIQVKDLDGNVVDEKYGMNLMTNYGMSQYFVSKANWPTNFYIGNGSGTFNHTTNVILSPITTNPATVTSSSKSYAYPVYYDSLSGVITTTVKFLEVYFNYNIDGVTGPVDISEYGIGTAYNALWTHSWVYNSIGEKSTVRKDINTRIDITVYLCMSYSTSIIEDGWTAGKSICITNPSRMFNRTSVTMDEPNLYTFRRSDYYARTKSYTSGYADNVYTVTSNISEFTMLPADQSDTNQNVYIDGFISWCAGFNMFERVTMPTGHEVSFSDVIGIPIASIAHTWDGFARSFGQPGTYIPFTQADITASYTYNYKTGQFSCPDHFVNDARKWYNEMSFSTDFATTARYTNNNEVLSIKLYRNINTEDPIVAISSANTTVYATDSYWDTSSWSRIVDLSSIPSQLQNKRYWLTTDDIAITPVRGIQPFEFIASDDVTHHPTLLFDKREYTRQVQFTTYDKSPDKKWFIIGSKIYIVARGDLVVTSSGSYAIGYNNLIMYYNTGANTNYFYETNITEQPAPVPVQVTTLGSLQFRYSHISESENGYAIASATSNVTIKFDLTGSSIVQTQLPDSLDACCISKSQNYAYIDATNSRRVFVKKLSDDTTVKQLDIPVNYAAPTCIFGWKTHLYITDNSTYVFLYDTANDSLTELSTTIPPTEYRRSSRDGNSYCQFSSCCDEGMILYRDNTGTSYAGIIVITENDPTTITALNNLSDGNTSGYIRHRYFDIISVNTNSLLMVCHFDSSGTNYYGFSAIDIGRYLHENVVNVVTYGGSNRYPFALFGEFYVCQNETFSVANLMYHRLVGTTKCVSTANHIKHISNKRWTMSVTNLGGWSGLPPGNKQ